MANIRNIMTFSGAALGATYALYAGVDIVDGLSYVVAGSGVAQLSIVCGKFVISAITELLLDASPPQCCEFTPQDIATVFTVGILDIASAHQYDVLNPPNSLLFSTLFAAGVGPIANEIFTEAVALEAERNRRRLG